MNNVPQVETREISDADLDNVAGGLVSGVVGNVTGTVDSIAPVSGVVGGVVARSRCHRCEHRRRHGPGLRPDRRSLSLRSLRRRDT
ncbi:hypothetical protein SMD44_07909 [Streptomyces alboflavus]|uniref:Type A2 lantipeptide n=1 Tax=Streptomyces alboflavus TaxID=67267 RepID=A0A1Z1WQ21_9ACTN|nr:hypothetical protein SMD44_07909 [Streptomyces alboflavus]